MKILQVITGIGKASGASTFCAALSNELAGAGHDVTLAICACNMGEVRCVLDKRVKVAAIEDVVAGCGRFDVVQVHGIWERADHVACRWARASGIPYVLSPHGSLAPWALRHHWLRKRIAWHLWFRRDVREADAIHVTAELERNWLQGMGVSDRVVFAPLGAILPAAMEGRPSPNATRVLLFVGRVYVVKAIDRLIEAFAGVDESLKRGWRLRIVGPDQAGHMGTLQRQVRELGLVDKVEFAGPRYDGQLADEYAGCDCLALVSHTENFGATVVDAMAHGKPVVTSVNTPWREVAERGCGWWVDNDPRTLARALAEMMGLSDEERQAMGAKGRMLVEEKYTWSAVSKAMLTAYRQVADLK